MLPSDNMKWVVACTRWIAVLSCCYVLALLFFRFEMDTAGATYSRNQTGVNHRADESATQPLVNARPNGHLTLRLILKQEFNWRGIHSPRLTSFMIAILGLVICLAAKRPDVRIALCAISTSCCVLNVAIPWIFYNLT